MSVSNPSVNKVIQIQTFHKKKQKKSFFFLDKKNAH